VASVRFFYPEIPIRLLIGGRVPLRVLKELKRLLNVEVAAVSAGDYGWGFIKLEPLFQERPERFLVLDSDTILVGPVLEVAKECHTDFIVVEESQNAADTKRLYYDWEKLKEIDPGATPPDFVFNSGQWFGSSNLLTREDFAPWLDWTMPRKLRYPHAFMPGDQGVLNYVLNNKARLCRGMVARRKIMRWPGNSMDGLNVESVSKGTAPPLVVHWAGMKKTFLRNMVGADLLLFFEKFYYQRLPFGKFRRVLAICYSVWLQWKHFIWVRTELTYRKWFGFGLSKNARPELVKQSIAI
jgi:hypothetical protein